MDGELRCGEARIALHIEMRFRGHREQDEVEHELRFGVVGMDKPVAVTVVSEAYLCPVISSRINDGCLSLDDKLRDRLALTCFKLMAGLLVSHDGRSGWWTIADVSRLIRKQFSESEADQIISELRRHLQYGQSVRSECLVADDDGGEYRTPAWWRNT